MSGKYQDVFTLLVLAAILLFSARVAWSKCSNTDRVSYFTLTLTDGDVEVFNEKAALEVLSRTIFVQGCLAADPSVQLEAIHE